MYFGVVLIILSSVQTILCSQSKDTGNETCNLCTISWFRHKRAHPDYTRWRANQVTTEEFIVKVLDDDLPARSTKKTVAVNIMPLSKNEKKIIVGGAIVSPPTTSLTTISEFVDYTRFIPPTTVPVGALEKAMIRSIVDSLIVTPRGLIKSVDQIPHKIHENVKNINRDESPPSGPQFLGRTKSSLTQQYAPVAPVSFYRGTTVAPLTPRSIDRFMYKTPSRPTRTFPAPDVITPSRTSSKPSLHDIFLFDNNIVTDEVLLAHNNMPAAYDPSTSSTNLISLSTIKHQDFSFDHLMEENSNKWRRNKNLKVNNDGESELSYNAIINNYEDVKDKRTENGKTIESDKDDQYELPLPDLDLSKSLNASVEESSDYENSTESESNVYVDEIKYPENITLSNKTMQAPLLKQTTVTESSNKSRKERKICSVVKLRQLNFNSPRTLSEIVTQLKQWAETSPVAKWVDITNGNYTSMENPIYMMIVDDPSSGQIMSAKKTVMIVAGIQGRDHHAVAAAMYVLYQLIERSEAHADLLTKYRFWIIPIFNPDGYDYSMTFPHKREWTKNLRQKWDSCKGRESCGACELYGLRCTVQTCYGVNLDRNFEYQWIPTEELRAEHPCGTLFAGDRQLSEAETQALTHFLHERRSLLYTFIAFKEGDVLGVLYPYSHTRKRRAFDNVYRQRASHAASAAYSIGGRPYVAGQTSEFLPLYAGGIEDWVDGHLGIDDTYTIMMFRPSDSYNSKLITERVVHEAYAAMDTLLLQSTDTFRPPIVTLTTATASLPASFSTLLMTVTPILFTISY